MKEAMIPQREACLYIDLECCSCSKIVALVNMVHTGRHYYCGRCAEKKGGQQMELTHKSPAIDSLITSIMGRDRQETIRAGLCMTCNAVDVDKKGFRDDLSSKEYCISGMCQECQDKMWGGSNG